ncbi:hypothetical protein [Mycobacterium sp. URHB0044]|uniref:hypothetical protein n=1 Tax=Mycobacterium sp. URHB0044 TaxID=1380386 RepID=UPI0005693FE2|nr:hypothetical protein [Mycobacterium sp. URHB0044]
MAESEASGESDYTGEFRLDDPVDTDRLAIQLPAADQESEPVGGGFDYLFDEPDPADPPGDIVWEDAHPVVPETVVLDEDRFDAFNANTWNFKPAALPWYRTQGAVTAIVAVVVAVVALVVSVVLLAVRGPEDTDEAPAPETSSTPTTAATTPEDISSLPPPPPPPPETSAPPPPPPPVYNRPRSEPRPSKQPEIGVTRTPITRSPISVAPQPRPHR